MSSEKAEQEIRDLAKDVTDPVNKLTIDFVAHMTGPMNIWMQERSNTHTSNEDVLKAITMGFGIMLSSLLLMKFSKIPAETRTILLDAVLALHCKAIVASLGERYLGVPKDD